MGIKITNGPASFPVPVLLVNWATLMEPSLYVDLYHLIFFWHDEPKYLVEDT